MLETFVANPPIGPAGGGFWPGTKIEVHGDEASHTLRVKRLRAGDAVVALDGRGLVAMCRVETVTLATSRREIDKVGLVVDTSGVQPPLPPRLIVCSAVPKGSGLVEMLDGLSQVAAAEWRPLATERGVVEATASDAKREKMERVCTEASKQCGRAWIMAVGPELTVAGLGAIAGLLGARLVIADADGEPWTGGGQDATTQSPVVLAIGPEGGFTEAEIATMLAAGGVKRRFGRNVLRIEVAAIAGAAVIMSGS